jgi:uncharacterized protein YbaR (Trm112 family)
VSELELFECAIRKDKQNTSNQFLENYKNTEATEKEKQNAGDTILQSSSNLKEKNKDIDSVTIIEEGVLFCNSCSRFYPIVEEIPIILPDNLRDKDKDLDVLKKWSHLLPEKIVKNALPWHL